MDLQNVAHHARLHVGLSTTTRPGRCSPTRGNSSETLFPGDAYFPQSIQYLEIQKGHPLISTFLIRTLMDQRYFHGVRTSAVLALANNAREEFNWIGLLHLEKAYQELFCYPDSSMSRPNDFSDRTAYLVQCAIPNAVAKVRDASGRATFRVRHWLYEKLRYNDNSNNEVSAMMLCS